MSPGMTIEIVDPDDDYLGIEIRAASERFAGSSRIYAGLTELSEFAAKIAGFPLDSRDERMHEFGSLEPHVAGGYCSVRLRCFDGSGHAAIEIGIRDADRFTGGAERSPGTAQFSFRIEAAALDRFTTAIHEIEGARFGEAILPAAN